MPLQRVNEAPSIIGVAANSLFTVGLPVGVHSYENLGLELAGTSFAKTDITNLQMLVNGKPMQEYLQIAHLENLSAYYGLDVNANEVVLPWSPEFLDASSDREKLMIGCADVATLQVRGQIGGATAPTMTAYANKVVVPNAGGRPDAQLNRLGIFKKVRNFVYNVTGTGTLHIDDIPREAFVMGIHIIQSADAVDSVEAKLDQVSIWDATTERMERIVERSGRTRQTNTYHLDFMRRNNLETLLALGGSRDFRLIIDHSATATLNVYVEYYTNFATA